MMVGEGVFTQPFTLSVIALLISCVEVGESVAGVQGYFVNPYSLTVSLYKNWVHTAQLSALTPFQP
jgi:hypothetical protein